VNIALACSSIRILALATILSACHYYSEAVPADEQGLEVAISCWLPVLWLKIQKRHLAQAASDNG